MAVTMQHYGQGLLGLWSATAARRIDVVGDTIKVSLHTSTYTVNPDTDDFWNDATNEVSGTGYTTGGATLGSKTLTLDTATDEVRFDAADTSWTTASFTARTAVIYKDTGTASTSPLMGYVAFGGDETVSSGTFQITYAATGVLILDYT